MAPSRTATAPYAKDEKVLCFHHEMLYEAKILEVQQLDDGQSLYRIHYKGWKNTWDDWVPQDRIRKLNDENRELALQLIQLAKVSQQKSSKPTKKTALKNGSDFSSTRGSEERTGGANALSSRGPRRARDYDLEHVSTCISYCVFSMFPIVCIVHWHRLPYVWEVVEDERNLVNWPVARVWGGLHCLEHSAEGRLLLCPREK